MMYIAALHATDKHHAGGGKVFVSCSDKQQIATCLSDPIEPVDFHESRAHLTTKAVRLLVGTSPGILDEAFVCRLKRGGAEAHHCTEQLDEVGEVCGVMQLGELEVALGQAGKGCLDLLHEPTAFGDRAHANQLDGLQAGVLTGAQHLQCVPESTRGNQLGM